MVPGREEGSEWIVTNKTSYKVLTRRKCGRQIDQRDRDEVVPCRDHDGPPPPSGPRGVGTTVASVPDEQ